MTDSVRSSVVTARLALETTLLTHGVPPEAAVGLLRALAELSRAGGARPCLCGVVQGVAQHDVSEAQLLAMLEQRARGLPVPKLNTSSLGAAMAQGHSGATTVSTTIEIAAQRGIRVFATGGLGGVHKGFGTHLDISTDLLALARWPVAVVTAGCKSILDVLATREMLETLGVPVIGWRTDRFAAFYQRDGGCGVDARFDDMAELGRFVRSTLMRSGRGVVIVNPIPAEHEIHNEQWQRWLGAAEAEARAAGATGRDVTPAMLGALHRISDGKTLAANVELVKHNVRVGAALAVAIDG
jgi:pseudouridine-5'-phosphate glycosidase